MKVCPYCAESIQDAAIKCRYCGSMLVPSEETMAGPEGASVTDPTLTPATHRPTPWLWIGLFVLAIVAGTAAVALFVRMRPAGQQDVPVPATTAAAARSPYLFEDIAWGTPANEVAAQLASHGFRFSEPDEEGDHVFEGRLDGRDALVIAMFSRGALAKVIVVLVAGEQTKAIYVETTKRLTERYGSPGDTRGSDPGRPRTQWAARADRSGETRLWTTVTDQGDVAIHYESSLWPSEARRRRAGSATRSAADGVI